MKSLPITLFVILALVHSSFGQLYIQSNSKGLYLEHTVVAKEGFFSVGRHYSVSPRFLASYNNLDINKGLNIGQIIHIPLTDTNFSQQSSKGTPIYYRVGEKEGLMKVSNANNKVKLASLREWNKLTNDNIKSGSRLIVGFLVPAEAAPTTATSAPAVVESKQPEVKKEQPAKPIAEKPEVVEKKPVTKTDNTPAGNNNVEQKTSDSNAVRQVASQAPKIDPVESATTKGEGYFKPFYEQQVKQNNLGKNETVTSGIFRTTYGLQEAKYYLLIDKVQPGTIVRIVNPDNNRAIFAKVLGEMSGIRQNKGLDIRISESAATSLGIGDPEKFIVKISY